MSLGGFTFALGCGLGFMGVTVFRGQVLLKHKEKKKEKGGETRSKEYMDIC